MVIIVALVHIGLVWYRRSRNVILLVSLPWYVVCKDRSRNIGLEISRTNTFDTSNNRSSELGIVYDKWWNIHKQKDKKTFARQHTFPCKISKFKKVKLWIFTNFTTVFPVIVLVFSFDELQIHFHFNCRYIFLISGEVKAVLSEASTGMSSRAGPMKKITPVCTDQPTQLSSSKKLLLVNC
jgi:hypothetical protein